MAVDNLALKIICKEINNELSGAFFDKPFAIGFDSFAFPYHSANNTINKGRGALIINLEGSNPFISYSFDKLSKVQLNTPFYNSFRKIVGCKINKVSKFEGERIIVINITNNGNIEDVNTSFDIIIELFPQKPNVYLVAYPYAKVVSLYKEKGNVFDSRYIARNLPYLPPAPRREIDEEFLSIDEIKPFFSRSTFKLFDAYQKGKDFTTGLKDVLSSSSLYIVDNRIEPFHFGIKEARKIDVSSIFSFFIDDQKNIAKKMKESELTNELKRLLKVTEKKEENLKLDLEEAKKKIIYKDYGQMLFLHQTEYQSNSTYLDIDNYHISLDPHLDIIENANKYFKKYHKSKSAITTLTPLIEKTAVEIQYLKSKLLELDKGTARDIQELKYELSLTGYLKTKKGPINNKKKKNEKIKYEPHYLISDKYKIGFGMNALQNECLTFDIASKDDIFLHISNAPGSHVLILSGDSNETRLLAAELALFLSDFDEGDIMVSKRKDVKKNKEARGLVNVLNYKLITLKSIRSSSIDLFKKNLKQI